MLGLDAAGKTSILFNIQDLMFLFIYEYDLIDQDSLALLICPCRL